MNNIEFAWQGSYYDHVIRNEISLDRIREYMRNNPLSWELDVENPRNYIYEKEYYEKIFAGDKNM